MAPADGFDFDDLECTEGSHGKACHAHDLAARAARSSRERARAPVEWVPRAGPRERGDRRAHGLFHGLELPRSVEQLRELGAAWLTAAFHAAGTIPGDVAVASVQGLRFLGARGAVVRLLADVTYGPRQGALHTRLLVKLPLPPGAAQPLALPSLPPPPFPHPGPQDHFREINFYRLLEGASPIAMPRYYFGDISSETSDFILITECLCPLRGGSLHHADSYTYGESFFEGGVQHMDVRGAGRAWCETLLVACAELAAMHKAGSLGSPDVLGAAFGCASAGTSGTALDNQWLGIGDTEFAVQAAKARDFVSLVGDGLIPAEARTPASMKAFRTTLMAGRNHTPEINWWCRLRPDYVALGPDVLDLRGVFLADDDAGHASSKRIGLCDWTGVSIGSLGQKLWRWLYYADFAVVHTPGELEGLIRVFTAAYRERGGPALDTECVRAQYIFEAAVHCSWLVQAAPQLYRWCPKENWSMVRGFQDPFFSWSDRQGSAWEAVRSFASVMALVSLNDVTLFYERAIPVCVSEHRLGCSMHPDESSATQVLVFRTRRPNVAMREAPDVTSTLMAHLPQGMPMLTRVDLKKVKGKTGHMWLQILMPMPGWAFASDVEKLALPKIETRADAIGENGQPRDFIVEAVGPRMNAVMEFFGLMCHTRRAHTGYTPQGTCITSAMMLRNEYIIRDKLKNLIMHLGDCNVVLGSFLAEQKPRKWFPKGYKDWQHHSFLVFDDGSIADITADQFDEVPQLWWPADKLRYTFDTKKADEAHKMRAETVGLERWQELVEKDNTIVARTRSKWMEIERRMTARPGERPSDHNPSDAREPSELTPAYYCVGSHTGWRMPSRPMAVDVASDGHVRLVEQIRFPHATMYDGRSGNPVRKREEFQVVLGLAWDRRFFPAGGSDAAIWGHWVHQQAVNVGGPPSMAQVGEPGQGHGRNFAVEGLPGAVLDIFFDPVACEVACDIVKPIW